jgi:hypothetical protein
VSADSSSYGIGAVLLQQQSDGTWRPVTFVSRALNDVEKRYSQVEQECLALTYSAERPSDYLIGTKFVLQTDHKPLVALLSPQRALDDIPPRIQRMRILTDALQLLSGIFARQSAVHGGYAVEISASG